MTARAERVPHRDRCGHGRRVEPSPALSLGEREQSEGVSNAPAIIELAPDRPSRQPGRPTSRDRHIREHNRGVAGSKRGERHDRDPLSEGVVP